MNSNQLARASQIAAVGFSVILLAYIMSPFASALFFAAVFASFMNPFCNRLEQKLHGRRNLAAGLLTLSSVSFILLPLGVMLTYVIKQSIDGVQFVFDFLQAGKLAEVQAFVPSILHEPLQNFSENFREQLGDFLSMAKAGKAVTFLSKIFGTASAVLLQTGLMVIALFFLLVEGKNLVNWVLNHSPLPPGQLEHLLVEFRLVTRAVLISAVATSLVQTIVALLGFLIARVPHVVFFTGLTFIAAFFPLGGASVIGILLAGVLLLTGHVGTAVFLCLWSLLAVGMVDNVVKPYVIKTGIQLHGAIILFALIGGVSTFGLSGIIAGPLIVAFFLAMLRLNRGLLQSSGKSRG